MTKINITIASHPTAPYAELAVEGASERQARALGFSFAAALEGHSEGQSWAVTVGEVVGIWHKRTRFGYGIRVSCELVDATDGERRAAAYALSLALGEVQAAVAEKVGS